MIFARIDYMVKRRLFTSYTDIVCGEYIEVATFAKWTYYW